MKKIIAFLLMILSTSIIAQEIPENIAKLNDKEKVVQLLKLSKELQYKDPKKAIEYAEKAIELAQSQNNQKGQADAYLIISKLTWELLDTVKASQYASKALRIYTALQDDSGISDCYQVLGGIHIVLANYPKALDFQLKALKIEEKENDQLGIVAVLYGISFTYFYLNEFEKSIEYNQKILEKAKVVNDSTLIGEVYGNIALNYLELKKYEKALSNYLKAIDYLQIVKTKNNIMFISQTALVYDYLGDAEKAEEYHQLAYSLLDKNIKSLDWLDYYLERGESYYIRKKYEKALESYVIGLEMSERQKNEIFIYDFYERIAITYAQIGDYQNAFQFQQKFMQLKDSIYNKQNSNAIAEMQIVYETEEKEQQIFMEQQKNKLQKAALDKEKNQKIFLIIGISLALIFTIYLFYSNYQRLKKNQLLATQKEEIESQNDQLLKLGSFKEQMTSMIAHDLKNPLNTIIGLSQQKNTNPHLITRSGRQVLTMVNNMLDVYKFEETEMQLCLEDISLKLLIKMAFEEIHFLAEQKNLQIFDKVEKNYSLNVDVDLIRRVFVNILSNAIKYSPNNASISLKVEEVSETEIKIFIEDEGIGIEKEYQKKIFDRFLQVEARKAGIANSTGLGLTFCKMVIEAHQGEIGVLSEKERGTSFWFTIKIKGLSKNSQLQENIFQEEIQLAIKELSESEKKVLKAYTSVLEKIALLEVGKITNILEEVRKNDSNRIKKWADEVENTVYTNNEEAYKDLISLNE